jgi:ParB family transcriptional regulator, chromosome partitioning protein
MTRNPLGRGLGALLQADRPNASDESFDLDTDLIDPGAMQPRVRFDEAKLQELAQSIRSNGVVQPLLVRRRGERYELIAGERRWRAARLAGLKEVPVVVRDVPDEKVLELALIENIQRENLNAIEEAQAYKSLLETIGLTQESLAATVGRDRSYITNYLRLLRLPSDIQLLLQEDRISTGHARTLLGIDDADVQRNVARKILERGLSVRDTEKIVRGLAQAPRAAAKKAGRLQDRDPNLTAVETKLRRKLGTQVKIIKEPSSEKGKIIIEFYSLGDLNRLISAVLSNTEAAQ